LKTVRQQTRREYALVASLVIGTSMERMNDAGLVARGVSHILLELAANAITLVNRPLTVSVTGGAIA